MSKAFKFMLLALVLSTIGSKDAFAVEDSNKKVLESIPPLKLLYKSETAYRKSNEFKDIKNSHARKKIKHFCLSSCGSKACGKKGSRKIIAEACQLMCPRAKIQTCLNKVS